MPAARRKRAPAIRGDEHAVGEMLAAIAPAKISQGSIGIKQRRRNDVQLGGFDTHHGEYIPERDVYEPFERPIAHSGQLSSAPARPA